MPRKSVPDFKSEAEEAAWYATPEGRRQTLREFERALKSGSVLLSRGAKIPSTDPKVLAELVEQAKTKATRPISLRLSFSDIERARRIAAKQGIGYQTVLKRAIRAGLNREAMLSASKSRR